MRRLIPRIKTTLRALSYRNYRLFFFGQGVSLIGTWMQNIALSWLVYRLTNSIFLLGLVGFLSQIMVFIFAPFSGVIADRLNRYKILLCTQTLAMLQAFVLAFLVLTGRITIWEIMLLGSLLGLINAFDIPARQSFIIKMVEKKEDLGNAIALNSSLVNMARLVGPSIAGLLIAAVGEGFCFLINGVSYIAVLYSLLAMKVKPFEIKKRETHIFSEFKEGLSYAYHFIPIRYILLLLAVVSLLGMPYTILMPVMARDILHGGPQTLGFLMGAAGIGAFCGAIYLASRKNVIGLVGLIALASGIFGVGLMALSFSRSFWISIPLIVIIGFGMMVQMAAGNTILQTVVEEKKRGRVLSLFVMAFMGMSPFGSLLAGTFAGHYGLPATFFYSGLLLQSKLFHS
ncbi:MAG: MFS transporter [Candidatus Saganbacteria bacterium]|nr:MFS transporter [Candidatus Saganbacteria bacterium]